MPWIMDEAAELSALRNFVAYATKFRRAMAEKKNSLVTNPTPAPTSPLPADDPNLETSNPEL
jgi:hypothetical protein